MLKRLIIFFRRPEPTTYQLALAVHIINAQPRSALS